MSETLFANLYLRPTKYLRFESVANPGRKTGVWRVRSASSDVDLGAIRWYGAWRQYVFYPAAQTLFNVDCLVEIADRVATCNRWQRNIRENEKTASGASARPERSEGALTESPEDLKAGRGADVP